ncbi:MAG: metal-dependent transcriptional regulator [SAR324 cluster bacterium]|nr:metal-dependent transcriptional regulator [SAR324 cluster bacterium]
MLSEKQEEIIEAIWSATEYQNYSLDSIRQRCPVDFNGSELTALEEEGLIISSAGKILFSENGRVIARGIIRKHRLAEVLVSSILKLKNSTMEAVACQIEHCLISEVEESICILLGHPEICPDGKPIPQGNCCKNRLKSINNTVMGLGDLKPGEKGRITYIKPFSHSNLRQLMSLGVQPGICVTVQRTKPAFCIRFDNTDLAIDQEIANNIFVWRMNTETN